MNEINKQQLEFVIKLQTRLVALRGTHPEFVKENIHNIRAIYDGLAQTIELLARDTEENAESFPFWFINDFATNFNLLTESIRDTVPLQEKLSPPQAPKYMTPDFTKKFAELGKFAEMNPNALQEQFSNLVLTESPPVGPLFKA